LLDNYVGVIVDAFVSIARWRELQVTTRTCQMDTKSTNSLRVRSLLSIRYKELFRNMVYGYFIMLGGDNVASLSEISLID
jgi:hypothetical protein